MWALLSPRFLIGFALVAALTFTHFTAYRHGKGVVRAEWNQAKIEADAESRRIEQRRQSVAAAAQVAGAERDRANVAAARNARLERDGLRDDLIAAKQFAGQSSAAAAATVDALSTVFVQCSRSYQELAEIADRHANDALTLRDAWPK